MKFYPNQLLQLLAKITSGDIKAILLYGHNRGMISAIINQLVNKFNFFTTNLTAKEANLANISLASNSSNFFKQKELIKIDYSGSSINKDLKQLLLSGDFNNFICFIGDESLSASGIRKLFEESNNLAAIGCYDDENMTLKLVNNIFTKHKKTISSEALAYIKSNLKGDYQIVKSEIEKLLNYAHDLEHISYETVKSVINSTDFSSGDEMCIFFCKKEAELFLHAIGKLQSQNINEILIIRALIRYYTNLFIVKSRIEEGQKVDIAMRSLSPPIFFKYVNDFKINVQETLLNEIIQILDLLQKSEVKIKNNAKNFDFFLELYLPAHGFL